MEKYIMKKISLLITFIISSLYISVTYAQDNTYQDNSGENLLSGVITIVNDLEDKKTLNAEPIFTKEIIEKIKEEDLFCNLSLLRPYISALSTNKNRNSFSTFDYLKPRQEKALKILYPAYYVSLEFENTETPSIIAECHSSNYAISCNQSIPVSSVGVTKRINISEMQCSKQISSKQ